MVQKAEATSVDRRLPRQGGMSAWLLTGPSWIVSAILHGLLLFVFAASLKSCGHVGPGVGEGNDREVGIYVKSADASDDQPDILPEDPAEPTAATTAELGVARDTAMEDTAVAKLLDIPKADMSLVGPGMAPPSFAPGDVGKLKPTGNRPNRIGEGGETSFFDISDRGTRFVYVLDRSGSMSNHAAIRVAKAELITSLQSLDATQQFQVVFYSQVAYEFTLGKDEPKLYWATDYNRTAARQFIAGVQPGGGTSHMPAIRKALKYRPDVLFFLTDADDELFAGDLDTVKQLNHGTRIHCIEFGNGAELQVDNFLKKLARQNGGTYRYRDITQLIRR